MKKFRRKIIIGLILLISAACCAIAAGCDNNKPKILDAPQNLRLESNVLIWDEVENATGYSVYFFEEEHEIEENYFDFSTLEYYDEPLEIELLAIGNKSDYLDSDWVQYSCNLVEPDPENPTFGHTYALTADKTGYVAHRGTEILTEAECKLLDIDGKLARSLLYVPDFYNGLPVKEIGVLSNSYPEEQTATLAIRLPDSVEKIADGAFQHFPSLMAVKLPESLAYLGNEVFYGCTSLTQINIPEGVVSIGKSAFANCTRLKTVNFPSGLTTIGGAAFWNCTALTGITLPQGVSVESQAFSGCTALTKIDCSRCAFIGADAFGKCAALTEIEFPSDVSVYDPFAFTTTGWYNNQPDGYVIVNGDTLLHYKGAVPNGGVIENFPSEIKQIAQRAFASLNALSFSSESKLVSVEIPNGVRLCGSGIFSGCDLLTHIKLSSDLTEIPASTFNGCTALESVELPAGITEIADSLFNNCRSLNSIVIPEGVTKIGASAFAWCEALEEVALPSALETIGKSAFSSCKALTEISLPDNLKIIESSAFSQVPLTKIKFPEGVTVQSLAFRYLDMEEIEFAENMTIESPSDFVKSVWYDRQPDGFVILLGDTLIGYKGEAENGVIEVPAKVKYIAGSAFYKCTAQSITIPNGVQLLGSRIFLNCKSLTHVVLPNDLKEIPDGTFSGCTSLESVVIPQGVTKIGSSAFYNCSSLQSVTLPPMLEEIGNSAFKGTALESFVLPETVIAIQKESFSKTAVVYYCGTKQQWDEKFGTVNVVFKVFFYSQNPPADNGDYWHFADDGVTPVVWNNEA